MQSCLLTTCRLDKEREHAVLSKCSCEAIKVMTTCRLDKEREHAAALQVLPDLLEELDQMPPRPRLTALIEGILAGNIFDWGSRATVELYHNGTILEIYRFGSGS